MRASLILPVWNGLKFLPACLTALQTQIESGDEILVVDNASTDGSADWVAEHWPGVQLIRNVRNLGFAGGCNVGLRAARGDVLVVLNQDTTVQPGWLTALREAFASSAEMGVVGCKALFPATRQIQHAGGRIEWPQGYAHHLGYQAKDDGTWDAASEVEFVTGAALALRRAAFAQVGEFDEGFWPGYFEDVDYCFRARSAGWRVVYWPAAVLLHHESPSTIASARSRYYQQGRLRFVLKHLPPPRVLAEFVPAEQAGQAAALHGHESSALRLAYFAMLMNLPTLIRARWPAEVAHLPELMFAFGELHEQAWRTDWQVVQAKLNADVPLIEGEPGRVLFPSARATDLLPAYAQTVQARRAASPADPLAFREYQFRSSVPLVGPLLVWLRSLWFNIAARWGVLYLMQQQEAINRRQAELQYALGERLRDLAEEHRLLAERLAQFNLSTQETHDG